MTIPKLNMVAIFSAIGAVLLWGWQPIESLFTGEFNENLNVQITSETIETCQPEKLLVLHIQPQNMGTMTIELGGKKGGSLVVTVKRIPTDLQKDQWVDPKNLLPVATTDILAKHPEGYSLDRNISYDEVETIAVQPGIYWAGVLATYPDGDYIDQSIVIKVNDEDCTKSGKPDLAHSSKHTTGNQQRNQNVSK